MDNNPKQHSFVFMHAELQLHHGIALTYMVVSTNA